MIASFTIKAMVKTTPKIGIVCGRYQFSKFYLKYKITISKNGCRHVVA
jgi:hypothetical protein